MSRPTVVILAGGQNSRFFPFNTTHKGHLTLLGQSLIQRTITNLRQAGFTDVVVVAAPRDMGETGFIPRMQTSDWGKDVKVVVQNQPLGMGDAVLAAAEHLTGQFAVVSNYHFQAGRILDQLMELGTASAVCVYPTTEPWRFGIVELENHHLKNIVEKPAPGTERSKLAIQSLYLLDQAFLSLLRTRPQEEYNFESALNELAHQQPIQVLELEHSLATLKYPWQLFDLSAQLFGTLTTTQDPTATVATTVVIDDSQGAVVIEAGATIGDFVKIVGPCYIGQDARVGDHSFIRGSSIEANCQVGAYTEVVRSLLMPGVAVHQSYVADSIIGPHVHLSAGVLTANQRLDKAPVKVMVKGEKVDTNRRKLGVMVGEKANIGIRVNTMPGVCIGSQATVYPNQTLYNHVDHQAVSREQKT